MTNDLIASLSRPSFDAGFVAWLATAPMDDIEGAYSDSHKDAYGFRARWVHAAGLTRQEFAGMFESLGYALMTEEEQEAEDARQFAERLAELGFTAWWDANGGSGWTAEAFHPYAAPEPAPLPYEDMAPARYAYA